MYTRTCIQHKLSITGAMRARITLGISVLPLRLWEHVGQPSCSTTRLCVVEPASHLFRARAAFHSPWLDT